MAKDPGSRFTRWQFKCTALLVLVMLAVLWAVPASAQGAKKREEGAIALLLLPLGIVTAATLQIAFMSVFPSFARRCHSAVKRYCWQTLLVGLAGTLALALSAALANQLASGKELVPLIILAAAGLIAGIGGTGVSLEAGEWALERMRAQEAGHPFVAIMAGSSVLGWPMILVPCLGQLLWLIVWCTALGAFIFAVLLGSRLDEAPSSESAPPPPRPAKPATPEPPMLDVEGSEQPTDDHQMF